MDTRWANLWFLLMLCAGCCLHGAEGRTITATVTPTPVLKGDAQPHTIRCDFSLDANDEFQFLEIQLNSMLVVKLYESGTLAPGDPVHSGLLQRGYYQASRDGGVGYLFLTVNDTRCSDDNKEYTCRLEYVTDRSDTITDAATVEVEAAPLPPNAMTRVPESDSVMEFSDMTFTCSGNVGFPAGFFQWYKFIGTVSGTGENITDQAEQLPEQAEGGDNSCTYQRTSRLKLNLTKTEAGENLVIRCRVQQKYLSNVDVAACTDVNTHFCHMSPQISVLYPVKVDVMSDTMTRVEGSDVSITCNTHGNPKPEASLVEWHKEGENGTTMGTTLTLSQVTQNDTGTYVCTAYNTIDGVTYNASVAVSLVIEKTTTPPPTTTPIPTTPETTTKGGGDPDKAGSGGDDTTIIIVVVVVVLVVVIVVVIAVIVFMRRRKKAKEVEEPPEKPFNNHAGINTVATRPDVVNDYNNSPSFKNEDGLAYAELQFDNKPRSRRPLAIDDLHPEYSDVSMPQV